MGKSREVAELGSTLTVDSGDIKLSGDLNFPWANTGTYSVGQQTRSTNTFSALKGTFEIKGADAIDGAQAMAGGDVVIRGGYGVANSGIGVYSGDVIIQGGTTYSGTDDGAGKVILRTGGASPNRLVIYGSGYTQNDGVSNSRQSYTYTTSVSTSVRPRLRNLDGTDFPKGQACLVLAFIDGTGTGDTDWFGVIGYGGSGASRIRQITGPYPGSSNRVAMELDSSGYPRFYTGHSNTYTVRVRVIAL